MPPVAPLPRLLSPPAALRDGKIRQGLRPLFPIRIKATGPQRRPRILPGGFLHNHAQERLFRRHAACSALLQGRRHGKSRRQRFFPPPQQAENASFPRPSSPQGRIWPSGGSGPHGRYPFSPQGAAAKACCIQCMSLRKFLLSRTLRIQEEHVMPAQCTPVKQNLKKYGIRFFP